MLEWFATPFSRGSSRPRGWAWVSFTIWATRVSINTKDPSIAKNIRWVWEMLLSSASQASPDSDGGDTDMRLSDLSSPSVLLPKSNVIAFSLIWVWHLGSVVRAPGATLPHCHGLLIFVRYHACTVACSSVMCLVVWSAVGTRQGRPGEGCRSTRVVVTFQQGETHRRKMSLGDGFSSFQDRVELRFLQYIMQVGERVRFEKFPFSLKGTS